MRLMARLKHMTLRHKLYLMMMMMVALFLLVYAYMNAMVENGLLKRLTEHNSQVNHAGAAAAREALTNIETLFSMTLSLENAAVAQETETIFRQLERLLSINVSFRSNSKLWLKYLLEYPYLDTIAMRSLPGPTVFMHQGSENFFLTMTDPGEPYMVEAVKRRGGLSLTREGGMLRASRAVINPVKYKKLGVMTVDADLSFLYGQYRAQKLFPGERYGLFIDGVLAAGDTALSAEAVEAIAAAPTAYESIHIDRGGMVSLYVRAGQDGRILSFVQIPYGEIFGQVFMQNSGLILAVTLYAVLLAAAMMLVVRSLLSSLRRFEGAFARIEAGHFGTTVTGPVEPELTGFLASFNRMSLRVADLIAEGYAKDLARQTLELEMLRNQINPHFFYNTLEALRMNSMIGREAENIQMIEMLSAILRYGISGGGEPATLADEIRHLEHYVMLHNLRSDAQIALHVFIPPDLMACRTIRLLFQPLVENAIQHGVGEGPLEICVLGYREAERIVFTVTDNGVGISGERLSSIRAGLSGGADAGLGIGLKNVHRRIQLFYGGDGYGLSIESREGAGTEITITLPAEGGMIA